MKAFTGWLPHMDASSVHATDSILMKLARTVVMFPMLGIKPESVSCLDKKTGGKKLLNITHPDNHEGHTRPRYKSSNNKKRLICNSSNTLFVQKIGEEGGRGWDWGSQLMLSEARVQEVFQERTSHKYGFSAKQTLIHVSAIFHHQILMWDKIYYVENNYTRLNRSCNTHHNTGHNKKTMLDKT